jgi:hypothetical protein
VTGAWADGSGLSGERITFVSESRSFFNVSFALQLLWEKALSMTENYSFN